MAIRKAFLGNWSVFGERISKLVAPKLLQSFSVGRTRKPLGAWRRGEAVAFG